MSDTTRDQAIALAALFQATQLVKQLAWQGSTDQDALEESLRSLFVIDADTVDDVYPRGVGFGLRVLRGQLGGDPQSRDAEVTRYSATLLHLERSLADNPKMRDAIGQRLALTRELMEQHGVGDPLVITRLAGIYLDTISTLTPRVMVNGEHAYLTNEDIAYRIRALLLAGVRAAVLWRQCRGSRWRLLFGRGALLRATEQLIHEGLQ